MDDEWFGGFKFGPIEMAIAAEKAWRGVGAGGAVSTPPLCLLHPGYKAIDPPTSTTGHGCACAKAYAERQEKP